MLILSIFGYFLPYKLIEEAFNSSGNTVMLCTWGYCCRGVEFWPLTLLPALPGERPHPVKTKFFCAQNAVIPAIQGFYVPSPF